MSALDRPPGGMSDSSPTTLAIETKPAGDPAPAPWWKPSPLFVVAASAALIAEACLLGTSADLQWHWLVLYCGALVALAPLARTSATFFQGDISATSDSKESFGYLAASSFISWIFAKSILNASVLGAKFGIAGGFGYAAWYTSFASAACVIHVLRRKGYRSLPEAIHARYGRTACASFGAAVLYRLFNEVWSNSSVVADFYGDNGSVEWWLAAVVSTAAPMLYVLAGGMRSSIRSDVVQAVAAVAFLFALLGVLDRKKARSFGSWNPAGTCEMPEGFDADASECATLGGAGGYTSFTAAGCNYATIADEATCTGVGGVWSGSSCVATAEPTCDAAGGDWDRREVASLEGGMDLLVVGLMQGMLSYPFFDPVLTDRCFLAEPNTMRKAFTVGGSVAGLFIVLFSLLGVYGNMEATLRPEGVDPSLLSKLRAGRPAAVAEHLGVGVFSVVNIIFMTSSMSTLDSTFTSCAKLLGPEFVGFVTKGAPGQLGVADGSHVRWGRVAIVLLAFAGTLPLAANPSELSATTVSGTVVLGLGPPVLALTFVEGYNPLMFHLPFWYGVAQGLVYQLSMDECCAADMDVSSWAVGNGAYGKLLGFNVIGTCVAFALCALAYLETFDAKAWGAWATGKRAPVVEAGKRAPAPAQA